MFRWAIFLRKAQFQRLSRAASCFHELNLRRGDDDFGIYQLLVEGRVLTLLV